MSDDLEKVFKKERKSGQAPTEQEAEKRLRRKLTPREKHTLKDWRWVSLHLILMQRVINVAKRIIK